ncbi:hypothetical protein [uncultured Microbacterium sp.]|nr:hypothetical protein [uncultured Microbacterium sp.]
MACSPLARTGDRDVPWRGYILWGLVAAPLVVALAVVPLAW